MRYGLADVRSPFPWSCHGTGAGFAPLYPPGSSARTSRREVTWEGVVRGRDRLGEASVRAIVASTPPPRGVFEQVDQRWSGLGRKYWMARPWHQQPRAARPRLESSATPVKCPSIPEMIIPVGSLFGKLSIPGLRQGPTAFSQYGPTPSRGRSCWCTFPPGPSSSGCCGATRPEGPSSSCGLVDFRPVCRRFRLDAVPHTLPIYSNYRTKAWTDPSRRVKIGVAIFSGSFLPANP